MSVTCSTRLQPLASPSYSRREAAGRLAKSRRRCVCRAADLFGGGALDGGRDLAQPGVSQPTSRVHWSHHRHHGGGDRGDLSEPGSGLRQLADVRQLHAYRVLLRDLRVDRHWHMRRDWRHLRLLNAVHVQAARYGVPQQHQFDVWYGRELPVLFAERESGVVLHHDGSQLRLLQRSVQRRRLHLTNGAAGAIPRQ